jgi:uncharacterized protein (TIGR03118 family)
MPGLTRSVIAVAALALVASQTAAAQSRYVQTNLVSDIPGLALKTDANLINPWGISYSSASPFWVSDAGTGLATLYNGAGTPQALVVTIPGVPTGQVFNGTGAFALPNNQSATFLFASVTGSISGWNPGSGTTAATMFIGPVSASYTGLAISGSGASARLYAANFGTGQVDVFDGAFTLQPPNAFVDPGLPAGYAPYNVQTIGSSVYVTYALKDPNTGRVVAGSGNGLVDAFSTAGALQRRFATAGVLNSPWGLALAPSTFGSFGGALLVGNFGDGRISGYDPITGALIGQLTSPDGTTITNSGLWGLTFGNGGAGGDVNTLYFAAGIQNEQHGLFGSLSAAVVAPEPGSMLLTAMGLCGLVAVARRRRSRVTDV